MVQLPTEENGAVRNRNGLDAAAVDPSSVDRNCCRNQASKKQPQSGTIISVLGGTSFGTASSAVEGDTERIYLSVSIHRTLIII
jgi:hypothetical protein